MGIRALFKPSPLDYALCGGFFDLLVPWYRLYLTIFTIDCVIAIVSDKNPSVLFEQFDKVSSLQSFNLLTIVL